MALQTGRGSPSRARTARRWAVVGPALAALAVVAWSIDSSSGKSTRPVGLAGAGSSRHPAPSPTTTAASAPVTVMIWGDSLAWEARDTILDTFASTGGFEVREHLVPGAAPCDVVADVVARALAAPIDVAVLEFSGNSGSACTRDPVTGEPRRNDALVAQYRSDVRSLIDVLRARGAHVVLAGAPAVRDDDGTRARITDLYAELARADSHVDAVDMDAVLSPGGAFAASLPCLPFETEAHGCDGGRIAVRSSDGLHLCPPAHETIYGQCTGWSSGAHRFGRALADGAIAAAR